MSTPTPSANHPPLAHDPQGKQIPLPEGTTHWRILRGRDTQPARFGLEMTSHDLLEMCGPGTYHVEASDKHGQRLALVTTLTVGEPPARPSGELMLLSAWKQRVANDETVADDDGDGDDYTPPWRLPPTPERGRQLEVILDEKKDGERTEAKVRATAHVLRVRGRLTFDEQRLFDDLIRAEAANDIIATIVGQTEDEAVSTLRRRVAGRPVASALDVLEEMTLEEQAIVMSTLLLKMSPSEASMLIRTYLAPDRTV